MTSRSLVRAVILVSLAVLLVWQVVSRSLVAYLATSAPETALKIRPGDPRALLNLAERHLQAYTLADEVARKERAAIGPPKESEPAGDRLVAFSKLVRSLQQPAQPTQSGHAAVPIEQIRLWAEDALAGDPLNARALRILGQIAERQGDEGKALRFMEAAARTSVRETVAVYWLMQKKYEQHEYDAALYFADALLRTRSQILPLVISILAGMAENPAAKDQLKQLLATHPPWRAQFFAALPRAVTDARTPLEFLLSVKDATSPAPAADMRDYLSVLMEHKYYELAYYAWLQFLAPAQLASTGFLFNGGFELTPSSLPFDWTMPAGTGVTIDIAPRPDQADQKALLIQLGPGRVTFPGIEQTQLLAPGAYHFKAQYQGEIIGRRGLVWRVSCIDLPAAPIGQSAMLVGAAPSWREVEFSFDVPDTECRAQRLRLELDARMASEQLVSGSVWFDDLAISREN